MTTVTLPEVVEANFKSEWRSIPDADYHKDLTAVARGDILSFLKSPASFIARRQKEENDGDSEAMRFGRAAHMLALEPGRFRDIYVLEPDFGDMRSSKNREKRDAWRSDLRPGSEALSEEDLTHLNGICEALLLHEDTRGLFEGGILEQCGYYRDPITGLKGRIKPDCVQPSINGLFDFKTARSVGSREFAASIWTNRYDIQLVKYAIGTHQIMNVKPDILGWVCIEKLPPYEPAMYIAVPSMIERGEKDYRNAMNGISVCMKNGKWPFRQKNAENIDFPTYVYYQEELLQ